MTKLHRNRICFFVSLLNNADDAVIRFVEMEKERGFKMTEKEARDMKDAEDKRLAYLRELEDAARMAEDLAAAISSHLQSRGAAGTAMSSAMHR